MSGDVILVLILFLLSALFSGSEVSIFSLSDSTLHKLKKRKGFFITCLLRLMESKGSCLIVILVGNLIVNVFLSSKVSAISMEAFGEKGLALAVIAVTTFLIVFSEITPKTLALKNAESFALASAPFLLAIKKTVYPLILFLENLSDGILNFIFGESKGHEGSLSTDELNTMVSMGEKQGVFDGWEKKLIEQIFDFQEVYAVEKMVPRPDIVAAELHESRSKVYTRVKDIPHSKIPVFDGDLDYIIGYFQVKDLLLHPDESIQGIMKPVYLIPEMKPIDKLLQEMQTKNLKLAVLLDEYGNTPGIITLEGVLDTIFGSWRDPEIDSDEEIKELKPGLYSISGATSCREINTFFDEEYFEEDVDSGATIAGFMLSELNKIPEPGDVVLTETFSLVVKKVEDRRIMEIEMLVSLDKASKN